MTTIVPPLRILKFGGLSCSFCVAMKKTRLLERFVENHPGISITELDVNDAAGEVPPGSVYEKNYEISEKFGVEALPTILILTKDGGEVLRIEGSMSPAQLEKAYVEALETLEAGAEIPWKEA